MKKNAKLVPIKPFIKVCVHTAIPGSRYAVKQIAEDIFANLDEDFHLPERLLSQVPLFADACGRLDVPRGSNTFKKFTALSLREARRNTLILKARQDLMNESRNIGIDATEIRGPTLGRDYYPARNIRHTHALKFAVFHREEQRALLNVLGDAGWVIQPKELRKFPHYVSLVNQTGVEAQIYSQFVPHATYEASKEVIGSLAFQVAMVLCQMHFERQQRALRWVSDLAFICATNRVDSGLVASIILELGLAKSCSEKIEFWSSLLSGHEESIPQITLAEVWEHLALRSNRSPKNSQSAASALRRYGDEESPSLRHRLRKYRTSIRNSRA